MEPFDIIEKPGGEHGSAASLRQQLAFAKERYSLLEQRVAELNKELEKAKVENEMLREELRKASLAREFVRRSGVLWKRAGAGFEASPYCPKCNNVMTRFPPHRPGFWHCAPCNVAPAWCPLPKD